MKDVFESYCLLALTEIVGVDGATSEEMEDERGKGDQGWKLGHQRLRHTWKRRGSRRETRNNSQRRGRQKPSCFSISYLPFSQVKDWVEHRIWSVGKEKNLFDYMPGRNGAGGR